MRSDVLKNKLKNCQVTIGSWLTLSDQSIAEIVAKSGFDWLSVDMEHSALTLAEAQKLIRVIEISGIVHLARVGENNPNLIKRVMDSGAGGVIVPMVNSKDDAKKAFSAIKYPPLGNRGVGLARAQGYGLNFEEYNSQVNKNSILVVQIEHIEAINNLEDILKTDGVDASIIGPYDLSASLGCPGDFKNKEVIAAIEKYKQVCEKLKKPAGFHVIDPNADSVCNKIKEGFSFIGFSLDTLFLGQKIKQELERINI